MEPVYTTRQQRAPEQRGVTIPAGGVALPGALSVPPDARALALFASCRGWSGITFEEALLAHDLRAHGIATLNIDLICLDQGDDPRIIFGVEPLTERLRHAARWAAAQAEVRGLPLAYVGTGTAAAAAVSAATAAASEAPPCAVVAWNGRLDLVPDRLPTLAVPTLLVTGTPDRSVARINATADAVLPGEHRLQTVADGGDSRQLTDAIADWLSDHVDAVYAAA